MELQKTAIFGTAHILRKVLMKQNKTYFTGKKKKNINVADNVTTEQLQKYIPQRYGFVLRNIIVNTLHKGGGDDDNNNIERVSPRVCTLAAGE